MADGSIHVVQAVKVRVGSPEDVHAMMELSLQACAENGLLAPNPEKLLGDVWAALNMVHGIIGIIGEPGTQIEGAVLLRVGSLWYSDQQVVEEKAIFIRPEYRSAKGGRAARLCEFSKSVADSLGLPLTIGVLSNERTAAKIRLYERQFGKPAGAYFIYNGQTGSHGGDFAL